MLAKLIIRLYAHRAVKCYNRYDLNYKTRFKQLLWNTFNCFGIPWDDPKDCTKDKML